MVSYFRCFHYYYYCYYFLSPGFKSIFLKQASLSLLLLHGPSGSDYEPTFFLCLQSVLHPWMDAARPGGPGYLAPGMAWQVGPIPVPRHSYCFTLAALVPGTSWPPWWSRLGQDAVNPNGFPMAQGNHALPLPTVGHQDQWLPPKLLNKYMKSPIQRPFQKAWGV